MSPRLPAAYATAEHDRLIALHGNRCMICGPSPFVELFSRRARLGWDTWGDEALHGTAAMVVA